MMKKDSILILIVLISASFLYTQNYVRTHIVSVLKNEKNIKKILDMNPDILMEKDGKIYIVAGDEELSTFQIKGLDFAVETQNFYPSVQKGISLEGGINGDFHSYPELERDLLALESQYADIAQLSVIGNSLESRNIYALKISDNVASDENEAEVLFIGCHHAREWISVEVPFLLGLYLLENYDRDVSVRNLVDLSEIWIVPLLNPDGLEYSIYFYRYWRKNRRDNGDGTFGVDLNRNYGYQWGFDNQGSSPNPDSEVYRGPQAFSEPETQAIRDLFLQHQFHFLISYHNYSQIILYPWGYTHQASDSDALLNDLAKNMSQRMAAAGGRIYDYGQAADSLYTSNGDTTDWSFGTYNIPSFTIELPPQYASEGQFFNAEEDIQTIFDENLPACLYAIDWAIQNGSQYRNRESFPGRKTKDPTSFPRIKK
jgi:carboxypeptidase T